MTRHKTNYTLSFSKGFISGIDKRLNGIYNDKISREDFFHLFYIIDKEYKLNDGIWSAQLPSGIRNVFGSIYINKKKTWKFKRMIDICKDKDILYSTNYSTDLHKSKSYVYTDYFTNIIQETEYQLNALEVTEQVFESLNKSYKPPTDPILRQHYDTICNLTIDETAAKKLIEQEINNKFFRISRNIATMQFNEFVLVTDDPRTGRIFTSFNLMDKRLREMCYYKGEKMISLDIKSSQPYFLASLLKRYNNEDEEVNIFYDLVTQHDLYDWLLTNFNEFYFMTYDEKRSIAKKMFFSYLYKDNRGTNATQSIIQQEFPRIYELVKSIKQTDKMWRILQKEEADVVITTCNEYVTDGCLSVHDALYFPESLKEEIEFRLAERFKANGHYNFELK